VPSRSSPLDTTIATTSAASIRFTSYPAGHVLGAAMFLIEIAGARILYTGDFSTEEDRHLIPASVPNWSAPPDVMISEATFGVQTLEPREEKESRLTALIQAILTRGGRVLMPVFALGRAQELLLILDEYWEAHPELHQYPIYYVSALAAKCMRVYKTHTSSLNANVQQRAARGDHPFDFGRGRHIRELKDAGRRFDDKTPCVVMASPGMLQNGVSRQLLEKWAPDRRNGLVLCGYSVEGTLARVRRCCQSRELV
jgi:cleavage and polyadenylation specificity factor subunit 3